MHEEIEKNLKSIIPFWLNPFGMILIVGIGEKSGSDTLFMILGWFWMFYFLASFLYASSAIKNFMLFNRYPPVSG